MHPENHVIVRVGTGHYHSFDGEEAPKVWERIKDSSQSLYGLVNENMLLLDVPLIEGKIYGEFANTHRAAYCWVVEGETSFDPTNIKGAPPLHEPHSFQIRFWTNPGHCILQFVPELGVVGYGYVHHGTTSETHLQAIECHIQPK